MPYVEDSWICSSDDFHMRSHIFSVQHYIFATPTYDIFVESSHIQKIWSVKKNTINIKLFNNFRIAFICEYMRYSGGQFVFHFFILSNWWWLAIKARIRRGQARDPFFSKWPSMAFHSRYSIHNMKSPPLILFGGPRLCWIKFLRCHCFIPARNHYPNFYSWWIVTVLFRTRKISLLHIKETRKYKKRIVKERL